MRGTSGPLTPQFRHHWSMIVSCASKNFIVRKVARFPFQMFRQSEIYFQNLRQFNQNKSRRDGRELKIISLLGINWKFSWRNEVEVKIERKSSVSFVFWTESGSIHLHMTSDFWVKYVNHDHFRQDYDLHWKVEGYVISCMYIFIF